MIVWDVIAETGICRLTGYKTVRTKVVFIKEHNILISSSKDTCVNFWDLDTEHNLTTLVGHRSEINYCRILYCYLLIILCTCNIYRVNALYRFGAVY